MASINWKTSRKAEIKGVSGVLTVKIKKSAGGSCYNLLNSNNVVIKSAPTVDDLKQYVSEYYRYL